MGVGTQNGSSGRVLFALNYQSTSALPLCFVYKEVDDVGIF